MRSTINDFEIGNIFDAMIEIAKLNLADCPDDFLPTVISITRSGAVNIFGLRFHSHEEKMVQFAALRKKLRGLHREPGLTALILIVDAYRKQLTLDEAARFEPGTLGEYPGAVEALSANLLQPGKPLLTRDWDYAKDERGAVHWKGFTERRGGTLSLLEGIFDVIQEVHGVSM